MGPSMEKPPNPPRFDDIALVSFVVGLLLAVWAGTVRYLNEQRAAGWPSFRWVDLCVRAATSGLAGVMAILIAEWVGFGQVPGALIAGVAGHAGAEGIQRIQDFIRGRYGL